MARARFSALNAPSRDERRATGVPSQSRVTSRPAPWVSTAATRTCRVAPGMSSPPRSTAIRLRPGGSRSQTERPSRSSTLRTDQAGSWASLASRVRDSSNPGYTFKPVYVPADDRTYWQVASTAAATILLLY